MSMSMKVRTRLSTLSFVVGLSGCSTQVHDGPVGGTFGGDVPSQELVSRIEAHLQRESCVGELGRWARFYRWQPKPSDFDGSLPRTTAGRHEEVEVILREAGKFGYRPGSFIEPSPTLDPNELYIEGDDRDYLVAFGDYTVATDSLNMWLCGPNLDADPGELIERIRP